MTRRLAIGAASATGLLLLIVGMLRAAGTLHGLQPAWTLLAVGAALIGNDLVCAVRWRILQSPPPAMSQAVRRYAEGLFLAVLVPGGIAGDVYRSTRSTTVAAGAAGVIADRAVGGLVTLALAVPIAALLMGPTVAIAMATVLCLLVALVALLVRRQVLPGRLGRLLQGTTTALALTLRRPTALAAAIALTMLYLLIFAVYLLAVMRALGVGVTVTTALVATPAVALAGMLPNVQGISPSHAVIAYVVAQAGAGAAEAVAVAALSYVVTLVLALLGGVLLLTSDRRAVTLGACP